MVERVKLGEVVGQFGMDPSPTNVINATSTACRRSDHPVRDYSFTVHTVM